jgi:micrococcal nuclease
MNRIKRRIWKAVAMLAAAFAIWLVGGEGFRGAVRAAFPAAPSLSARSPEPAAPAAPGDPKDASPEAVGAEGPCDLVRVIDGDTVRVRCGDGSEEPVRLVGVDAPEVARQGKPADCGAASSTEALAAALADAPAYLYRDPDQGDRDRYGRLLRFLATSSTPFASAVPWEGSVNLWLVRDGASLAYRDLKYGGREAFALAEAEAHAAGRGLWGSCPEP